MFWYRNPFRKAIGLFAERIDMGVDYGVHDDSPIYSPGVGRVVRLDRNTANWPGGYYIAVKFTRGRAKGKVWYLAEHLSIPASLHVGSRVTFATKIAILHPGFPNCETGWARDIPGYPPLAYGCYKEGDLTHAGINASDFLHCLGAPAGLTMGRTPKCPLPTGWRKVWC